MNLRVKILSTVLFGASVLATAAWSQTGSRQVPAPRLAAATKRLEPGQVDTALSRVYVFVGKEGFGHEHAVEGRLQSGTIQLGSGYQSGKLVFDMNSFNADTDAARSYLGLDGTTAESTRKKVNANMLGPDVLNAKRFPTATFDILSAVPARSDRPNLPTTYALEGTFTLHAMQRPLKVQAQVEEQNGLLHFRGNFAIRQSQFGIKPYSTALGAIGVADELKIHGDIWVVK